MPRLTLLLLTAAAAALVVAPAPATARTAIRVGISDEQAAMFTQPAFQRAKFKRVRYFVPWNAMDSDTQRLRARAYVLAARAQGIQVLLHVSTDDYTIKQAHLPSVSAYHAKVGRLVRYFRALGVREFGTWNEVNHASQPTYRSPTSAASFFREMYRMVKGGCRTCAVVALDVLDQAGVDRYMRSFFRALSPTYRARATVIGVHNYGDVNRRRTTYTRKIIQQAHAYNRHSRFWLTETGGIVKFGASFPCSESRAASRLKDMFSIARRYRTSGIERLYIYNWTGAGCAARFDAGLTAPDGTPRAGYAYVRRALPNYLR
jgi:hypothetical protein